MPLVDLIGDVAVVVQCIVLDFKVAAFNGNQGRFLTNESIVLDQIAPEVKVRKADRTHKLDQRCFVGGGHQDNLDALVVGEGVPYHGCHELTVVQNINRRAVADVDQGRLRGLEVACRHVI